MYFITYYHKKATVAMKQIWGIDQKKFKEIIIKKYECSIVYMRDRNLGMERMEQHRSVQDKYLKWVLGFDWNTPRYIAKEETKRMKLRVET